MQPVVLDTDVASLVHKGKLTGPLTARLICLTYDLPLATLNLKDFEDFPVYHGLRILGTD